MYTMKQWKTNMWKPYVLVCFIEFQSQLFMYINFSNLFRPIKFVTEFHLYYEIRMPKIPPIPFAFECNQPNGNLVDLGKKVNT